MSGWAPEPREGRREPLGATGLPLTTEKALAGAPDASNAYCPRCTAALELGKCVVCGWVEHIEQPMKHDAGKNWMPELLPFGALREVSRVFAYGARKYAPHNFRQGEGLAWSRLLGAALRHLFAWGGGEDMDPESGCSHLAHAAACCLMLLDGSGTDDRWKGSKRLVDADWGDD